MSLELEKGKVYQFIVEGLPVDYTIIFDGVFWGENNNIILRFIVNDGLKEIMFLTQEQLKQIDTIKEV
jgi:hypothetical protein